MRADSTLSESQREELVALFEQGFGSRAAANRVGVRYGPAQNLYQRFKLRGRLCLVRKRRKQEYPFSVKKEVVERYLAGETQLSLAREFGLWSDQQVKDWAVKWRKGGDVERVWSASSPPVRKRCSRVPALPRFSTTLGARSNMQNHSLLTAPITSVRQGG